MLRPLYRSERRRPPLPAPAPLPAAAGREVREGGRPGCPGRGGSAAATAQPRDDSRPRAAPPGPGEAGSGVPPFLAPVGEKARDGTGWQRFALALAAPLCPRTARGGEGTREVGGRCRLQAAKLPPPRAGQAAQAQPLRPPTPRPFLTSGTASSPPGPAAPRSIAAPPAPASPTRPGSLQIGAAPLQHPVPAAERPLPPGPGG